MKLVLIPSGEFEMGSPASDKEAKDFEKPRHRVQITRPFYLGATEVTQGQYRAVTGQSPSHFNGSDDLPVEQVSWNDAVGFCSKLSELDKVQSGGASYRLPTEAEWEHACRAGSTTRYSFGDDGAVLGGFAWHTTNSGSTTRRVGRKEPNPWKLYDMHGNVHEWCWDLYADSLGPSQAGGRVSRGGGWGDFPQECRSAARGWSAPGRRVNFLGFRVARIQSEVSPVPPPVSEVAVNPPAQPIAERKPAPNELVPDAKPAQAPEEASKKLAKKSTGPGARSRTTQASKDGPEEGPKEIMNSIGMKLVLIPAGMFAMGSPASDADAERDEKPQRRARITQPFYVGATEVTQGQYRAVTGQSPSLFKGSDDLPVEQVTWDDAIAFCSKLSELEKGQLGGASYRLPTEAEWEYACRGGKTTRYYYGDDAARLGEFAWYNGNSGGKTHPVGQKRSNAFNLYDMNGNVWERCWGWVRE